MPTSIASSTSAGLAPDGSRVISVMRFSKEPLSSEESYLVVIDELADPLRSTSGGESLAVQYVLPVLFRTSDALASG
ncbi:hypothetical protein M1D34_29180 (plasmid) [Ensifer sp. D2-11]